MAKRSIKRNSRAVALLACIALAIALLPATASAEDGPETGTPLAASALGATRGADGERGGNLTWTLDDDGTLTISGTGAMDDWNVVEKAPWYDDRAKITKVVIESGVTSIGDYAFSGCTNLESVSIPGSVTSIGEFAFNDCTKLQFHTDGSSVIRIPPSVKKIGQYAFSGCYSMYNVRIAGEHGRPSSVKSIGKNAFEFKGTRPTHIYIDTYEGQVAEDADSWRGEAKVIWYWSKISAAANPTAGGTVTVTGATPLDENWIYDKSKPATLTATAKSGYTFVSWTNGEGNVVSTDPSFTLSDKSGNQDLTANFGLPLTITAKDQACTYNGETQGEGDTVYNDPDVIAGKVKVEGLRDGDSIGQLELFSQGKDVGTSAVEVRSAAVMNGATDVTKDYAVDYKYGTLTIGPAEATVTTGSATKAYDGKPLTNPEASITGLVNGETATVTATGSQTEVGSSPNTYSIEWGTADAKNYTVTEELGTLTVEAPKLYTVKWLNYDGAELYRDVKVPYGTVPKFEGTTPTRPFDDKYAYEFAGWEPGIAEVTGDATYTAKYKATPRKGTLTFDLAGGTLDGKTGTVTVEANVGDTIKLPGAPTKKGYAFKCWKGSEYAAGAEYKVEGDHAFTAEWVKDGPTPVVKHTVTFDANGHGKAPDAQTVEHGEKAKRPASPTASGYTFGGWYKDKACKEAYDFSKPVTADLTLYAKWTKKSSSGSGTSPKTGDPLAGAFAIALALAAASALALALSRRRSRD